ncbi:hypothetical protein BDP27DRAFT_1363672 [Rhodocollybia butyracea]|uniref:Uncharacterized protein n=1 Tax=Rhodocollybia butyracea TaxID=206335 RepID=A0A9P5PVQ4_9AGAR|nr:hypothetical protein BDP27DRAFT_1363672 [Rhodocollybia butyracea]
MFLTTKIPTEITIHLLMFVGYESPLGFGQAARVHQSSSAHDENDENSSSAPVLNDSTTDLTTRHHASVHLIVFKFQASSLTRPSLSNKILSIKISKISNTAVPIKSTGTVNYYRPPTAGQEVPIIYVRVKRHILASNHQSLIFYAFLDLEEFNSGSSPKNLSQRGMSDISFRDFGTNFGTRNSDTTAQDREMG